MAKNISSQFLIEIKPDSYVYQHKVEMYFITEEPGKPEKVFSLSKSNNLDNKKICRNILNNMKVVETVFAYDGREILLTPKKIKKDVKLMLSKASLSQDFEKQFSKFKDPLYVNVTFEKSTRLNDFGNSVTNDFVEDRSYRMYVEMILAQEPLTRSENPFCPMGHGEMCEAIGKPYSHGLFIHYGHTKGVHIIADKDKPQMCISMDCFKKVLYPGNMNFHDFIVEYMANNGNLDEAEYLFKGMRLQRLSGGSVLVFKGFTKEPVKNLKIDDGRSLMEFYRSRNVQLKYPNDYAALLNAPGDFPLELLKIAPYQAVSVKRMSKRLAEKALEANIFKPEVRYNLINEQMAALQLNNKTVSGFGLKVSNEMMPCEYRRFDPVKIILGNKATFPTEDIGSFKYGKNHYFKHAELDYLVALSSEADYPLAQNCAVKLTQEFARKGKKLAEPKYRHFNTASESLEEWKAALGEFKDKKTIVLIIDGCEESHSLVKLAEALTGVKTQHIKRETATKGAATFENITHKLNVKGGGLNHEVFFSDKMKNLNLNSGKVLVMGLDVCHPTGAGCKGETQEPSIVGIVGNYLADPNEFCGTFFFQNTRKEEIESLPLKHYTSLMLKNVVIVGRKPHTIVVVRDGISEGQYPMFMKNEIPAVEAAASQLSPRPKILAMITTKRGNTRQFFSKAQKIENFPPRSFISSGCRFNFRQFYAIPHHALKGTAQAILATIIRDDLNLGNEEIQEFLLLLTHSHEIVASPISIPCVVQQADDLAQRGQLLFRAMAKYAPGEFPLKDAGEINFMKLTQLLNISNADLPTTRYTA